MIAPSWFAFVIGGCGGLTFGGGTYYVAVGAGGLPYQRGCVLKDVDPVGAVVTRSGDFYDAKHPGRAHFTCGTGDKATVTELVIRSATALTIDGPASMRPNEEIIIGLHASGGGDDLTFGPYPHGISWTFSGSLTGGEHCHDMGGCTSAESHRMRAGAAGTGIAEATFGGLTARYTVVIK